ncbi:GNAT family N-acetyltransferase [Agromyces aerolatus]|uniref:GNAT family N-acetyltransferase n=1 Tax=Agromyces sp. LY-1074 TaxID=3074080 RepID=UPI002855BF5C|nr:MULTISPECIES: GNAT family N-acetyltransferase [unclassified Agromyces]MDR5701037.1 GNAT family N-acetyltransferase [Agromyces sp. LY-1074]MDR5707677.1 GNAT family N-acetyltransferase [Agromyces sp. LY-1358]
MLRFREAAVTDADAHALLIAYFAERAAGFPVEQGVYRPTFPMPEQFEPPAGVFLIVDAADADGDDPTAPANTPLGCGGVRRIPPSADGLVRYEVKHLWLRPEARGSGGGRMLLQELERRAVAFGAQELVLDTNASLEAAGGLYHASGYVPIEPYNDNPNATNWYGKRV